MASKKRRELDEFRNDLRLKLKKAESELQKLGYGKKSWKELLKQIAVFGSNIALDFEAKSKFDIPKFVKGKSKKSGLRAFNWAFAAAFAHLALNCKSIQKAFAYGAAMEGHLNYFQDEHKKAIQARKARLGKFGSIRKLIEEILATEPNLSGKEIIQRLSRGERYIENLLERIESRYDVLVPITDLVVHDKSFSYKYDEKEKHISFGRIFTIKSEILNPKIKKNSRNH